MLTIKKKFAKTNRIFDLFFPKFCVGCQIEGTWLCDECFQKIVFVSSQVCPQCGRLSLQGRYCTSCRKGKSIRGIICAAHYNGGPTKELIHNLKYNSVTEIVLILGKVMAKALQKNVPKKDILITFAPLHRRRLAQRGFNQAELLAKNISKTNKIPMKNLLEKKKNTKRQVELKGRERRKNLEGVFAFKDGDLKGKTIIIVDDVTTTGATLNECAKVLKKAGAKEVWGLVVARG